MKLRWYSKERKTYSKIPGIYEDSAIWLQSE